MMTKQFPVQIDLDIRKIHNKHTGIYTESSIVYAGQSINLKNVSTFQ